MGVPDLILDWWATPGAARDLPWRRTRDPWAILVSEVMLQQTQAARVVPAYHRFLARFPTASACASAPVGDVVRAWDGLGYNRRAVNLHRAATACGGALPADLAGLLALPGIGPYTARAVLAFAHEADVAVLDVNAVRALSRLAGARVSQADADAAVPAGRRKGWAWNSALLDFGATVCTAASPACASCPVARHCRWRSQGGLDPGRRRSRQSTFEGSDRQGRGRLVAALRRGPVAIDQAATAAGWPGDDRRAAAAVASLVADGLAVLSADGKRLTLP